MSLELTNGSSDRIEHGTALGNFTACSICGWIWQDSQDFAAIWQWSLSPSVTVGASDPAEIRVFWFRSGGPSNLVYETNNCDLTTGKWWFLGVTIDQGASSGNKVKVYLGDLATPPTSRTFGTSFEPDAYFNNNGATFYTGGNPGADPAAMGGRFGTLMFWPGVVLTEAQTQMQQFNQHCPVVAGCTLFTHYGYNGISTQPDWSGTGNVGTVTGATVADHVPLTFRKYGPLYVPYTGAVAPPAGAFPQIFRSRIFVPTTFRGAA